jgi:hypothetical protein
MTKPGVDSIYANHGSTAFVEAVRQPGFPATFKFRPWRLNLRSANHELAQLAEVDFDTAVEADRVAFSYMHGPDGGAVAAQWNTAELRWEVLEADERGGGTSEREDFHADC